MFKFVVLFLMLVTSFFSVAGQQMEFENKSAPLPSQIFSAKKVFISNAGGEWNSNVWSGGSARVYDEFYAGVKSWGHYEIVLAPADADLILQISFAEPLMDVSVTGTGGSTIGNGINAPQFKLILLDPKTHVVLWTFTEHLQNKVGLKKSRDKAFDETLNTVLNDLKALTKEAAPAP